MKKGIFIVIDGNDGSGKATQVKLLKEKLLKENMEVEVIDFPNYKDNFFGEVLDRNLHNTLSRWDKIEPEIASIIYAADRWESKDLIKKHLREGKVLIADRYVSANQIHQGGKIKDIEKRKKFMLWLEKLEYKIFKIPKPDLVIYLSVPVKVSENLLEKRYLEKGGKKDAHEANKDFLVNSKNCADWLSEQDPRWMKIECCNEMELKKPEEIASEIFTKLKNRDLK